MSAERAIVFETDHPSRQIVEVDADGDHVSVLIYTKSEGGGLAYLTRAEAVRLRQAIDAKIALLPEGS